MPVYDAFISYSHARDKPIAAALQSVIQKLGKPWYRRRSLLHVFRDDTSLSATPQLWPSIEQALSQSRFLLLLSSLEAAGSHWVGKEVEYWLRQQEYRHAADRRDRWEADLERGARRLRLDQGDAAAADLKGRFRPSRNGSISPPIGRAPIRAIHASSSLARTSPPRSTACRRRTCCRRRCGSNDARAGSRLGPLLRCLYWPGQRCGNGMRPLDSARRPFSSATAH